MEGKKLYLTLSILPKMSLCIKHLREKFNTKKKIQGEHLGTEIKKPFLGVLSRPKRLKVWVHDPQNWHEDVMKKIKTEIQHTRQEKIKLFFFLKKNTEIRKGKECTRKKQKNDQKSNTKCYTKQHEEKQIKKKPFFHPLD